MTKPALPIGSTRFRCLWAFTILCASTLAACDGEEPTVSGEDAVDQQDGSVDEPAFDYQVPLDPESPWPKFRRNALQNGRSPVLPVDSGRDPWTFRTSKGIFSTPVIDGEGTVYIGSADRTFYAIDRDGEVVWQFLTGEIIDSSALLDDQDRVFFGSGDGRVYALDRRTGNRLWTFEADDPATTDAFIRWFEGNVAMTADGTLIVPNDNFCTYALDRESGSSSWCFPTMDQTWSLAAYNPATNRLFMGNNFYFLRNIYAIDAATGQEIWHAAAQGSVAASPLLTSTDADGLLLVGGFDGLVRAFRQETGAEVWQFGTRDHIYASPAQMEDGTIVQPSADGTVYALDPEDGALLWAFDTSEPIRSSPSIDGAGNIYLGSGEGRLFVLNPDGTLRWSIQLIDEPRNDLNASPALGTEAIVIAGENGGVFSLPYDYCLRPDAAADSRCTVGPGELFADDGVFLVYTDQFGGYHPDPPQVIEANQPLTFSLIVREEGDTRLALIDSSSVAVAIVPEVQIRVDVSGDRKFITVVPQQPYFDAAGGALTLELEGDYLVDLDRNGLRFTGGRVGGRFDAVFEFSVSARESLSFPLAVPTSPGDDQAVLELSRLAAPLPTILPSYNQIGFDSIHYLIGLVEGDGERAVAWAIAGRLAEGANVTEVDPTSQVRFPIEILHDDGSLTMVNQEGFTIVFNGFPLPFDYFRVSTRLDASGHALFHPSINTLAVCGDIDFYGAFLQQLGTCNPDTDLLDVFGAGDLAPFEDSLGTAPEGLGTVSITAGTDAITAALSGSSLRLDEHNFSILLVQADTERPLAMDYVGSTGQEASPDGLIQAVSLGFTPNQLGGSVRAYLMVDTYPAAVQTLSFATQ